MAYATGLFISLSAHIVTLIAIYCAVCLYYRFKSSYAYNNYSTI